MLTAFVSEDQRHWDAELQKVTCALRCALHEATGLSPNFIVYGREIHLNGIKKMPHLVTISGNNDSQQKSLALQKLFVDVKRREEYVGPFEIARILSPWTYALTKPDESDAGH
ncbi:hypothetical protein HHI36_022325 [Cryptolaemus montrouzieri]|uniref:Uncharacterized protein n=1 Tax=Cryptolaemus montrouzieri TaxID=559131 RepID=A0ABD2MZR1_9CUCU